MDADTQRITSLLEDLTVSVATMTEKVSHLVDTSADQEGRIRALEIGRYKLAGITALVQLIVVPIVVGVVLMLVKS